MSESPSFLQAIIAAPDDDTPRLVYADWLDEHGEPERAEFIRLQIEHHRQSNADLEKRADAILARHRNQWIIPGLGGVQTFRRGFVEGLYTPAADFVLNSERIGRLAPVVELRLPIAVDHLAALAAVPWLNRVESLDLTGNVGLGSRLDYFFGLVELPKLKSLELRNCQLWPEHVAALGRLANRWPRLERLNLSGNPIGNEGVERLAAATALTGLRELILRCDEQQFVDAIHAAGASILAKSQTFANLQRLDLHGHYLGDAGFISIVASQVLRNLVQLDLSYNDIGIDSNDCFDFLFDDRNLPRLKSLFLDGNRIEVNTFAYFALEWKRLPLMDRLSLRDIDLPVNNIMYDASPWRDRIDLGEAERGAMA